MSKRLKAKRLKALRVLKELNELEYNEYKKGFKHIETRVDGELAGSWDEDFVDEDTGEVITIERKCVLFDKISDKILESLIQELEY